MMRARSRRSEWFGAPASARRALAALFSVLGCGLFGYEELAAVDGAAVAGHCSNGAQDADETGLDCGGPSCPACAEPVCIGDDCANLSCTGSTCPPASCSDGLQNRDETDTDCGGSTCGDCPTCYDVIQNQGETGVDCGGINCSPCPSCGDGSQNQDETGVDCGGATCSACALCSDGSQNQDEAGVDCGGATCPACPTCGDGSQNQDETDIDCGGVTCPACPTCSDGIQNQGETGIDCGGGPCAPCGINTPPSVSFTVTPGTGSHDGAPATTFQGDAGATSDREDAENALSYAWDWDNDGVTDDTGVTSSHVYGAAGTFTVRVSVQDTGGLGASSTRIVIVSSVSGIVQVTTAADEDTGGATPASPGGTGLSLREAVNYAASTAGRQSIFVPAGFSIALSNELSIPTDAAGMDILGDGVVLDGSGTGPSDDCIQVDSGNHRIFGLEIRNCRRSPLRLEFTAAGSQFSRLNIHDNPQPVVVNGPNVRFGPDNEVSNTPGYCLSVVGQNSTIDYNFIHDCDQRGIDLTGSSDAALVLGNVVTRCDSGLFFGNGANNLVILHNVLHENRNEGIAASTSITGVVLRNNVFSNSAGFGVWAADSIFAANDHNDYFGNGLGACDGCSLGTASLSADPLFMDSSTNDFRLQPGSPLIDVGIDTGNDVNGPAPGSGLFNGSNPDIGARESN